MGIFKTPQWGIHGGLPEQSPGQRGNGWGAHRHIGGWLVGSPGDFLRPPFDCLSISTCGLVAMMPASRAEGCQFNPDQVQMSNNMYILKANCIPTHKWELPYENKLLPQQV